MQKQSTPDMGIKRKYPEPVVLVTTHDADGRAKVINRAASRKQFAISKQG